MSLEKALKRASQNVGGGGFPDEYYFHAAEVLEQLLGPLDQGQIATGRVAA